MMRKALLGLLLRESDQAAIEPQIYQRRALQRILDLRVQKSLLNELSVKDVDSFRDIPSTDYSFYEKRIERLRDGNQPIAELWGKSRVRAFALSSGTTSTSKYIPINDAFIEALRSFVFRSTSSYIRDFEDYSLALKGYSISLASPAKLTRSASGLAEGYISGLAHITSSKLFRRRVLPADSIVNEPDWDKKFRGILTQATGKDVAVIGAIPTVGLFGTEKFLEISGKRTLRELWPNLRLWIYSGQSLSAANRELIRERVGATAKKPFRFLNMYSASEGQFGFGGGDAPDELCFNALDCFFQFRAAAGGSKQVFQLHELREGEGYEVLITTPGGLLNYEIGDHVEVTRVKPYRFRVCGRSGEQISVAFEKISPQQLSLAFEETQKKVGSALDDFAVYLEEGRPSRLNWVVPGSRAFPSMAIEFDRALSKINATYGMFLLSSSFYGPCSVLDAPKEVFSTYLRKGIDRGQFKPKRLFQSESEFKKEYGIP